MQLVLEWKSRLTILLPIFFTDSFGASLAVAGMCAGMFGLMNIFARAMGGIVADKVGKIWGFDGKVIFAGHFIITGRIGLIWFAKSGNFGMAIFMMFFFCLVFENGKWSYL